ncbi:MAG: hypothetical protein FWF44_05035 [Defluviitaleaceae bacterium]|nr:hypothetical protein [Defluviitaleaceae bacterium]
MRKTKNAGGNKNILKLAGIYSTVIIGAGFASGQELMRFFASYGAWGVLGLLVSGVIFSGMGWAVLDICHVKSIRSYQGLTELISGGNKFLGVAIETAAMFFMFVVFATMLAAGGATLKQSFGLPFSMGAGVVAAIAFVVMLFDVSGLVSLNAKLAPVLVLGGAVVCALSVISGGTPVFGGSALKGLFPYWLLSAVIYSAYNMITAVSVLSETSEMAGSRRAGKLSGILGGGAMTLLGLCLLVPLLLNYSGILRVEIPILHIAGKYGQGFGYMYLGVLFCAIITSSVSNAFAMIRWLTASFRIKPVVANAAIALLGFGVAHVGFSVFVGKVYPVFGLVGLVEIGLILRAWRMVRREAYLDRRKRGFGKDHPGEPVGEKA